MLFFLAQARMGIAPGQGRHYPISWPLLRPMARDGCSPVENYDEQGSE
jgi:hypothetical protein